MPPDAQAASLCPGRLEPTPNRAQSTICVLNPLDSGDEETFFHLSEGSELLPFAWVLALQNNGAALLSLQTPGYGLHPDAQSTANPYGAPIGVTVAPTVDTRLFGIQMFGFNCAACHVAEMQYGGQSYRVIGAPSLFDIETFLADLSAAVNDTLSSLPKLLDFIGRVVQLGDQGGALANLRTMLRDSTTAVTAAVLDLEREMPTAFAKLEGGSASEAKLSQAMTNVFTRAKAAPVAPAGSGLRRVAASAPPPVSATPGSETAQGLAEDLAAELKKATTDTQKDLAALFDSMDKSSKGSESGPKTGLETHLGTMGNLAPTAQKSAATGLVTDLEDTIALLRQRVANISRIRAVDAAPSTPPGPGRVDAFITARNVIFQSEPIVPMKSPVRYPHLWAIHDFGWFHWDGNTTSFDLRNVGQAIGVGAVVDSSTFLSTVQASNLKALERIAEQIQPPPWPFGLDASLVNRGRSVYAANGCPGCHGTPGTTGPLDAMVADDAGLDPNRAESFAMPMSDGGAFHGEPFVDALRTTLQAVADAAVQAEPDAGAFDQGLWRATRAYAPRRLDGVWAAAPYLHDGSVRTLADLLNGGAGAFAIGDTEFDTQNVGYVSGGTLFDPGTLADGNGNSAGGHPWGVGLAQGDAQALLEYLKSL